MKRRKTSRLLVGGIVAILLVVVAIVVLARRAPTHINIATGFETGTYYPLGKHIASILSELDGFDAEADVTSGSVQNIEKLLYGKAQLGFVLRPALIQQEQADRDQLRALCRLYSGVMHVLVRDDGTVNSIDDLRGKKIYLGEHDSGNRIVAKMVLDAAGFTADDYKDYHESDPYRVWKATQDNRDARVGFKRAIELLVDSSVEPNGEEGKDGEHAIDVVFIAAGRPTTAVQAALSRVGDARTLRLLSLDDDLVNSLTAENGDGDEERLTAETIPAGFYPNQVEPVSTIQWDSYLVCRKDLADRDARDILNAVFSNIRQLLEAHTKAEDIKLVLAFSEWTDTPQEAFDFEYSDADPENPRLLKLHDGARDFLDEKRDTLFIATGALGGKYYDRGLTIQKALERAGIKARVLHTDGSLENAELLEKGTDREYQVLGILQLDTALASLHGRSNRVYGTSGSVNLGVPSISNLHRIATFDEEKLHIFYRHEEDKDSGAIEVLGRLARDDPSSICLGPKKSGTQLVMNALLQKEGIAVHELVYASVPEMMTRLSTGDLRVGCMMSAPSASIAALLDDSNIRLLSLKSGIRQRLISDLVAFEPTKIEGSVYGDEGDPEIKTIATTSVLVANEHVDDVPAVTKAIFEAAPFFGPGITKQSLAQDKGSLELHEGAEAAYQDLNLVIKPPPFLSIAEISTILGTLVVLLGALKGAQALRRDRVADEIGRRIIGIKLGPNDPDPVERLLKIHDETKACVRNRWWSRWEIDRRRWRHLQDLIDERVGIARSNLVKATVARIRTVSERHDLDDDTRNRSFRMIERRVWDAFTRGRLSLEQKKMLRELIAEAREHGRDPVESP